MADWPEKIAAIAARTATRDIRLLAGIPSWVLILAEALRQTAAKAGRDVPHLRALWPQFECFVHGGVPIAPYLDELRAALGPGVTFHEVYPASEGFIAVQDAEPEAGLRLLTDAGIFYEFLPLERYDESALDTLGAHALTLAEVEAGRDYVLLMTTPAGLCRYVIGDVVRFVSTAPPRLVYAGRTKLQLSAFGEHVIEKELTDALTAVARQHSFSIAQFHVAPLFVDAQAGRARGAHEWWLAFAGNAPTASDTALAAELDAALRRSNDDYDAKRQGGGLEPPQVRRVPPNIFEQWLRARGKWGGQNKFPRCRSDREVADELARLSHAPSERA
jgi:hypothetical protein